MSEEKNQIFNELVLLAIALGTEETEERLQVLANILSEYDPIEVKKAIKWAALNLKFFPKPVELLERICPKPDAQDADALAGEIIKCITRFGYMQGRETRKHVGEVAWSAVEMAGGWSLLCETPRDQLANLRAQLRGMCLASLNAPEIESRRQRITAARGNGDWFKPIENTPARPGLKLLFSPDESKDHP